MAEWVRVTNTSRGGAPVVRARWCAGFTCRMRGLMFRRRLEEEEGLLLVGRGESRAAAAIHMGFVFFPLAALWLDGRARVVDVRLAQPFRPLYVPRRPARYVLEGAPALLEQAAIGDQLRFEEEVASDE